MKPGIACALLLAGCGDRVFELDPPELDGAEALILVFELEKPRAFALDPRDREQAVSFFFGGGEVTVYALLYDRPLEDLGLTKGELSLVPEGRELPDADRPVQRAVVGGGGEQPWTDVAFPPLLEMVRIPIDPTRCDDVPRFELELHALDEKTNGRDIVDLGDGTAMVSTDDGTFYRIGHDLFERLTVAPRLPSGAIYRAPNGAMWFAGRRGKVVEMIGGAITRTATAPSGGSIARMSGPSDPRDALELLMLDFETSALLRFDGTSFTELSRDFRISNGDVVWTGPGRGFAVRGTQSEMLVIDGDNIREEDVNIGGVGADSLAVHPELGPFVGSVSGRIVRKKNDTWIDLGDLTVRVESLAVYEDGVVAGGLNGTFGYWSERTGLCVDAPFPSHVEKILPIGDDIAVTLLSEEFGDPSQASQPTYVVWMHRPR